jgi:hypothetical protein
MRRALFSAALAGLIVDPAWSEADSPPGATPPECQQLVLLREEVHRHAKAIETANREKAGWLAACKLFRAYLAAESRMINAIHAHGAQCGVPAHVVAQWKTSHVRASRTGTYVCIEAGVPLDPDKPPPRGDFWRPGELDRVFGRPRFEH